MNETSLEWIRRSRGIWVTYRKWLSTLALCFTTSSAIFTRKFHFHRSTVSFRRTYYEAQQRQRKRATLRVTWTFSQPSHYRTVRHDWLHGNRSRRQWCTGLTPATYWQWLKGRVSQWRKFWRKCAQKFSQNAHIWRPGRHGRQMQTASYCSSTL